MSVDLKTKEGRDKFLKENLADVLNGVNDSYGPVLVDELLRRIDCTITEFNNEMTSAFELLKEKDKKRIEAFEKYEAEVIENNSGLNAWEKKINETENK
tara:strand:- start:1006 stop:1302 length:297 start_codon:yes stop_codon:yes gene_type:complete